MTDNDKIERIIKKRLDVSEIDKEKSVDDPFVLAAIGIEIEEDLDIHLSSTDFMLAKTVGDIKRVVKNGSR